MGIEGDFALLEARTSTETPRLEMVPSFDPLPIPSESASGPGQAGRTYLATSESYTAVREDFDRQLQLLEDAQRACRLAGRMAEAASIARAIGEALEAAAKQNQTG